MLDQWISSRYRDQLHWQQLRASFLAAQPFPHLELPDFFLPSVAEQLRQALRSEPGEFKEADLFAFSQTADLVSSRNPLLRSFRDFLASASFVHFLEQMCGQHLTVGKVDLSGTRYEDTHFLLCHDDQLEGRKIAFMVYLSSLEPGQGGALQLFSSSSGIPTTVAKKIIPRFNTFHFFLVSKSSFHAVEEVINAERWTLSGWFHG